MIDTITEKERFQLPSFDCPNPYCTAKNIVFAMSREVKNVSELIPISYSSDIASADFAVICPKCKSIYVLHRHREIPFLSSERSPVCCSDTRQAN